MGLTFRTATRKTPRSERTRGSGTRRALQRPPHHSPGWSHFQRGVGAKGEANAPEGGPGGCRTAESESRRSRQGKPSPCPLQRPVPGRVHPVRLCGCRGTGRCWSTRSGRPRTQIWSAGTVTHLRNLQNQSQRQQDVPRPRRHRDCRRQHSRCLRTLPRARRLSHNPPEGIAKAPEGRDNIKAAARWLPTTGSNVPRTGRCLCPPSTPQHRPPKRPSSARSLCRGATRCDTTPAAEGEELGNISSGGYHEGDALPHAIPGWWRDIPRRRWWQGLTRGGVGGERGTSDIPGSPGPPPPKEGGSDWQNETRQALLGEQSRTFESRHRHRHASPGAGKEKKTLGPPTRESKIQSG